MKGMQWDNGKILSVAAGKQMLPHGKGEGMSKYYIIIAYDGTEVIDATPGAEGRIATMDYLESRHERECRHKADQRKLARNPLYRLACLCGLV